MPRATPARRMTGALLGALLAAVGAAQTPAARGGAVPLSSFGASVALTTTAAFVGEPWGGPFGGGVVHVFGQGPGRQGTWRAVGRITPTTPARSTGFGVALAADLTTLVIAQVGLPNAADSARGAVHIYRREADQWRWTSTVLPDQRPGRAEFGAALAFSDNRLLVGAPGDGGGVVYLFRRGSDGTFRADGKLPGEGVGPNDRFGSAIAVEGNRIAVGAPGRDANQGAVMVFTPGELGEWKQEAVLASDRLGRDARLGASVALRESRVAAGAPGALPFLGAGGGVEGAGAVVIFDYSPATQVWRERHTLTGFEVQQGGFGRSLAWAGQELWIATARTAEGLGRVLRVPPGADGAWTGMQVLEVPKDAPSVGFVGSLAVAGDVAALPMPNGAFEDVAVWFLGRSRSGGGWTSRGIALRDSVIASAAVRGREVPCGANGTARHYPCRGTSLLSFLPISLLGGKRGTLISGVAGWTDAVGKREIAIVGRTDGTSFVDVTNSIAPRYLGELAATSGSVPSRWREVQVFKDHLFVVADSAGAHGLQVFDLARLRRVTQPQAFRPDVTYDRVTSVRRIVVNEAAGLAYLVGLGGRGACAGTYHVVDVRQPKRPRFVGCVGETPEDRAATSGIRDATCVAYRGPDARYGGREVCVGTSESALEILDVTDKKDVSAVSRTTLPVATSARVMLSEDHRHVLLAGVVPGSMEARTLVWDLADLRNPVPRGQHASAPEATVRAAFVAGGRLYQASSAFGLRVLDLSDPTKPNELAFFDTQPTEADASPARGARGVFRFATSGTIVVTSAGEGMFLLRERARESPE